MTSKRKAILQKLSEFISYVHHWIYCTVYIVYCSLFWSFVIVMALYKIRFYCPIKVPARGRVISVIYITKNILIHKCNKQYTNKQFVEIRLVHNVYVLLHNVVCTVSLWIKMLLLLKGLIYLNFRFPWLFIFKNVVKIKS
jgi:hypothetical protein